MSTVSRIVVLGWALLLGCFSVANAEQEPGDALAAIDALLQKAVLRGFNGALLIRIDDETLLHRAYGVRDPDTGEAMTVDHGFTIGSIVKPITTVAILRLEELGKLRLDDPLSRFFPEIGPDKAGITLRQILSHRAGLPDTLGADDEPVTREQFERRILDAELLFEPGSEERYSNAGFSVLAMVIESVSGHPYETFVQRQVLHPGDVTDIGYRQAGWRSDQLAVGQIDGRRWGTPLDRRWMEDGPSWNLRGNGGMLATTQSLCRWYEALFDGRILGPEALERFMQLDTVPSRRVDSRVAGHAGGNDVFNALQISYIALDAHVTLFSSNGDQPAQALWSEIRPHFHRLAGLAD